MAERAQPAFVRRLRTAVVRALPFLGALSLYLLLGLILWWSLNWYIEPNKAPEPSTAKKDLFQALGFLMAGVAGAVGVYFTCRNLSQTRESTERTLWLTEQGQITERFTRAIDQLGATADDGKPKLEIRLGGIYALERIARDSPERDYSTVMEVLTAYVRENAKRPPPKEPPTPATTRNEVTGQKGNGHRGQEEEQGALPLSSPQGPRADIRAIVDVLRREKDLIPQEYRARHDLRWTDLEGADLQGASLEGANLKRANLERVCLKGADLVYADLRDADLRGADLRRADLQEAALLGANLREADLKLANLVGANLQGADLPFADLSGANLESANLEGAILATAKLPRALLSHANLRDADLSAADLSDARLREADLQEANLTVANMQKANLEGTNLQGAYLLQARLGGANLQGARSLHLGGLHQESIEFADGDETTILPEGLPRPASWSPNSNSLGEPGEEASS